MENLHPFNGSQAVTSMAHPVGPFYFPTQQFGFSQQLFPAGVWPQTLSTTPPLYYLPHWMIQPPQQMQPQQMQPPLPAREKFKTFRQRTGITARKKDDEEYVPRLANRQKEIVVDEEWQEKFTALKKFQTTFSRLPMNNDKIDGFKISEWVQEMRNTRHWLSRDRVENLETVQGWTWEVRYVPFPSGKWDDWHNILQQFVEALSLIHI
jgi:hypothetical protein